AERTRLGLGIGFVHEVWEGELRRGGIVERDVAVRRVHQLAEDLVNGNVKSVEVFGRAGRLSDAIESLLQLLGLLALGYVEGDAEHGGLAIEIDERGGEIDPALGAVLRKDAKFVAAGLKLTALARRRALHHVLAELGMDQVVEADLV